MTVATSPTSSAPDVGFPRPFGKYLLVHPLAEGGMGAVYLAKASGVAGIEKLCVVKTLRPALVADDDYAGRFLDEARLVVQLAHRNICSVFDVGHGEGRYYLAMEHIAGRDVRALLARLRAVGGSLSEGAALHLLTEVLDALDYAHRLRDPRSDDPLHLVHRDVSPQNIMVNFEGEVKLIDFGLAVSTLKGQRTEPQSVMGKIAYMSPEQARGEPLDGRSDQFAAAIVLYEALTTQRYYGDMTPHQIWGLSGSGDYQPDGLLGLGDDIVAVLRRALSRQREDRFPSCAELREALEAAQLARGVKSGDARRELRDHMQQLFDAERQSEKQLLASLAVMEATGPAGGPISTPSDRPTTGAPVSSSLDPSRSSSVSSPSSASLQAWFSAASEPPTGSPPEGSPAASPTTGASGEVTALHARAAGLGAAQRSSKGLAVGALVVAALALIVVGLQLLRDPEGGAASSADAVAATVSQPPSPSSSAPSNTAPSSSVPSNTAPANTVPSPTPGPSAEPVPDASAARADAPSRSREVATEPRTASASEGSEPTTRAKQRAKRRRAQRAKATKPAEPPTGYTGMLDYVKQWCRAEPCTSGVLAHDRAMRAAGEPSTDDLLRAVKALRACVERCAR